MTEDEHAGPTCVGTLDLGAGHLLICTLVETIRARKLRAAPDEGTCQTLYVDEARVAAAQAALPSESTLEQVADFFSALSDPTRLRILTALTTGELCVCDLAKVAGRSMGATSHQLQLLRRLRLVKYRMEGKLAYYSLDDAHVRPLLESVVRRRNGKGA